MAVIVAAAHAIVRNARLMLVCRSPDLSDQPPYGAAEPAPVAGGSLSKIAHGGNVPKTKPGHSEIQIQPQGVKPGPGQRIFECVWDLIRAEH
jgi:hypothetical protein